MQHMHCGLSLFMLMADGDSHRWRRKLIFLLTTSLPYAALASRRQARHVHPATSIGIRVDGRVGYDRGGD